MELFDRYFWMILLNFKDSDLAAFLTKKMGAEIVKGTIECRTRALSHRKFFPRILNTSQTPTVVLLFFFMLLRLLPSKFHMIFVVMFFPLAIQEALTTFHPLITIHTPRSALSKPQLNGTLFSGHNAI